MKSIEATVEEIRSGKKSKKDLYKALEDFIDLQAKVNFKYTKSGTLSQGDLLSVIWLGIEEAIKTYRPDKGCSFLTWASRCIRFLVLAELKKLKSADISLDSALGDFEDLQLENVLADPMAEEEFSKTDTKICGTRAMAVLNSLPRLEKDVIILCCIKGKPISYAAKQFNVSPSAARLARNRGLSAIRKKIE